MIKYEECTTYRWRGGYKVGDKITERDSEDRDVRDGVYYVPRDRYIGELLDAFSLQPQIFDHAVAILAFISTVEYPLWRCGS